MKPTVWMRNPLGTASGEAARLAPLGSATWIGDATIPLVRRAPPAPPRTLIEWFLCVVAYVVWCSDRRIAAKLEGYSATEAGSALDMLKAAELSCDPTLRPLFFRHAMDEARHARLFHEAARAICPTVRASERDQARATRQNLYAKLGLTRFIAFVYLAEARGEAQFRALARRFHRRPELGELFTRIARDERFHVAYSRRLLDTFSREGRGGEVRRALWSVRGQRALEAWRRSGRVLGDAVSQVLLGLLYLLVLPLFAVVARAAEPGPTSGWRGGHGRSQGRAIDPATAARRQF
jgi:rubrerythrin